MTGKKQVRLLFRDTYIAVIKNSVGSKIFRNSYAKIDARKVDILQGGKFSCAFFVSSILIMFGLIKEIHATVDGTIKDLKQSGWERIKKPRIGSVLVWEAKKTGKEAHGHIGFYIGDNKAISNDSRLRRPLIHHWTFSTASKFSQKLGRKVELIYWNKRVARNV